MSIHMMTGGTGLVGAALILELLQQSDATLLCLVRDGAEDADTRLHRALQQAVRAYGCDKRLLSLAQKRCSAIPGDVRTPLCGCSVTKKLGAVEQFWHCAASLQYEDPVREEIFRTNLQGTQHALDLAKRLNVQTFNHISTAYVSGKLSGLLREEMFTGHEMHNTYEVSKLHAEEMVLATSDFRVRIFRPSTVVGHSQTFAVSGGLTGIYGLGQKLLQVKQIMARLGASYLHTEAPRLLLDPDLPVNLIPVDAVAHQTVRIAFSSSVATIFHITNSTPPTASLLVPLFRGLGVKEPILVSSGEEFTAYDHELDKMLSFYQAHFFDRKVFDRTNSNSALGDELAGNFSVEPEYIERYMRWFVASQPSLFKG